MNTILIRPLLTLKLATLAALVFLMLLLNGCHWVGIRGNGHITTDTRQVTNFTSIEADGAFEVKWTSGAPAVSITTDSNLLEYMRTRVTGDRLRIQWDKPLRATSRISVNVSSPALRAVQLNGAVRFFASNLRGGDFFLDANGATRVALDGNTNALTASLNGASRLDANDLVTRTAELSINGAGRADVNVADTLRVAIAGAGRVSYTGTVQHVEKEIHGAGRVSRRD